MPNQVQGGQMAVAVSYAHLLGHYNLLFSCSQYKDMLQLMIDASDDTTGGGEAAAAPLECPMHQLSAPSAKHKLTAREIVDNSVTFLVAGYETTANTLSYVTYLLALNPDIQEKLQSEIDSYFDDKPVSSTVPLLC